MGLAGEMQKEGVTAKLQEPPAKGDSQVEKGHEATVDGCRQLLGADLAVLGQALRELGEAGNVHEGERSLDLAVTGLWSGGDPIDRQTGKIGSQGVQAFSADVQEFTTTLRLNHPGIRGGRHRSERSIGTGAYNQG